MKRYLLFTYLQYYPSGGWQDFIGSFDTVDEARDKAKTLADDYADIVDTATGQAARYSIDWDSRSLLEVSE